MDKPTLDANWAQMGYDLIVDGYVIDLEGLTITERVEEWRVCRHYAGVLTGWTLGSHTYIWVHHIYQGLNDGWDTYPAGDYMMEFTVDVQAPTPSAVSLSPSSTPTIRRPTPTTTPTLAATRTPTATRPPTVSVRACPRREACITYPFMDTTCRGIVRLRGTATRANFDYYKFEYRSEDVSTWSFLSRFDQPVINGVLLEWDTTNIPRGTYWLRLIVVDKTGNYWPEFAELRLVVSH